MVTRDQKVSINTGADSPSDGTGSSPGVASKAAPEDSAVESAAEAIVAAISAAERKSSAGGTTPVFRRKKRFPIRALLPVLLAAIVLVLIATLYVAKQQRAANRSESPGREFVSGVSLPDEVADPISSNSSTVDDLLTVPPQELAADPNEQHDASPEIASPEVASPDHSNVSEPAETAPWNLPTSSAPGKEIPHSNGTISFQLQGLIRAVREAVARRDLDAAKQALARALSRADHVNDRNEVERWQLIVSQLEHFWVAVDEAAAGLSPEDTLLYRDVDVHVVLVTGASLTLAAANGEHREFSTDAKTMDPELAVALALRGMRQGGPAATFAAGTFLAVDNTGNRLRARQLLSRSGEQSVPVELLFASVTEKTGRVEGGAALVDQSVEPVLNAAEEERAAEPKRLPVPERNVVSMSVKQIRDAFKGEYDEAAGDRELQLTLANKLLQFGHQTNDDASTRYALFLESRRVATAAFDVGMAFRAIDTMGELYDIDMVRQRKASLEQMAGKVPSRDKVLVGSLLGDIAARAEAAAVTHEYGVALDYLTIAIKCAIKRGVEAEVRRELGDRKERFLVAKKAYAKYAKMQQALNRNAEDPRANDIVGRYLCFTEENWSGGLPLLAKSSNSSLKNIAAEELKQPIDASTQKSLGDAWLKFAESSSGDDQAAAWRRARIWYQRALLELSPLERKQVEDILKRSFESDSSLPQKKSVAQRAYEIDRTLRLYKDKKGWSFNYRGKQEKYMRGKISVNKYRTSSDPWYVLTPDGVLYEFTPPYKTKQFYVVPVTLLTPAYWENPDLLVNAPRP